MLPLFLNKIGTTEIIIIVALVLVFFGGRKIPQLMRSMGRGVKEFKDAVTKDYSKEFESDDEAKADDKSSDSADKSQQK